jgi:glycosyltransferase involved in cell wall biosynthesis
VVDDGSADGTAARAREAGVRVLAHDENRGKGAALVTGLRAALEGGFAEALTVDADGQHPGDSCRQVLLGAPAGALVLGVRDLARDGAPRLNRFSNGISNFFLSAFAGRPLGDTQCGLRRYPIAETLALGARSPGYAFEAEIVLLAAAARVPIVEVPVRVTYPPPERRLSHFHAVRDPARIIGTVLGTVARTRRERPARAAGAS